MPDRRGEFSKRALVNWTWFFGITAFLGFWLAISMIVSEGPVWRLPENKTLYSCWKCAAIQSPYSTTPGKCENCGALQK